MADISSLFKTFTPSLSSIKTDLLRANRECSQRKLFHSAKWYELDNCFMHGKEYDWSGYCFEFSQRHYPDITILPHGFLNNVFFA